MKLRKKSLTLLIAVALLALTPVIVYAYTICNTYGDGCTICDFYNAKGEWQGYVEWCH
ncbi:MAG: hypothetical protein ABUT39_26905 [Acidobacteriota bacterium]